MKRIARRGGSRRPGLEPGPITTGEKLAKPTNPIGLIDEPRRMGPGLCVIAHQAGTTRVETGANRSPYCIWRAMTPQCTPRKIVMGKEKHVRFGAACKSCRDGARPRQ